MLRVTLNELDHAEQLVAHQRMTPREEAGELVGPVETPDGFALVRVEERRAAELDPATRQRSQDRLFADWLSARLGNAILDTAPLLGTAE